MRVSPTLSQPLQGCRIAVDFPRVADRGYPGKSTQYILNPEGVASASCKCAFHQPYRNPLRVADRGYPGKSTQCILNPEGVASASCKFAFHQPYRNPLRVAESPWAFPGLPIAATLGKAHNISSTLKGLRPHPANARFTNPIATPSGLPNRRGLSQGSRSRLPWEKHTIYPQP